MHKARKIYIFIISTLLFSASLSAQVESTKGEISFNVDLMSRYVWRGTQFSTGPVIQPNVAYTNGNFTAGAWGSYSQDESNGSEIDLYLSYTFANDMFTATVTDYFFPTEGIALNNSYFDYKKASTGHIYEATLAYNATEKFPINIMTAVNFWGADQDASGDQQYSLYVELGYDFKVKDVDLSVFSGFTPIDPDESKGESGFYGDTAGFVNLGFTASKEIKLTNNFSLPVSASIITNPMNENLFLVVGVSL